MPQCLELTSHQSHRCKVNADGTLDQGISLFRATFLNQNLSGARGQHEREGLNMQSRAVPLPVSLDTCVMGHNKKSTQENPLIDLRARWETTKTTPGCLLWFASFVGENTLREKRNHELEQHTKSGERSQF